MFLSTITREPIIHASNQEQGDISTLIKESIISKSETVDLSDYAKLIKSNLDSNLHNLVLLHVSLSESYLSIASDLSTCDSILDEMGVVLSAFQQDLFKISEEIETLQISSGLLATRLKNRRDLEAMLKIMLDGLVISSDLVKKIFEAEITEFFIMHLGQVDSKMTFVRVYSCNLGTTKQQQGNQGNQGSRSRT